MRTIILSALFAAGIGLAGVTSAAAAPAAAGGYTPLSTATPLVEQIQYYRHRHRRYCTNVRRCYRGRYGRLVCRVHRVCRWR